MDSKEKRAPSSTVEVLPPHMRDPNREKRKERVKDASRPKRLHPVADDGGEVPQGTVPGLNEPGMQSSERK